MRFIGDYPAKIDAKGRVFVPAALRKMLEAEGEQKFVLRNDVYQRCLVLYPESVWNAMIEDMASRLNPWNKEHQALQRQFMMGVEPVELDGNGRILISRRKLDYAGIAAEVRFVGIGEKIEVWSNEVLEQTMSEAPSLGESMSKLLG